MEISVLKEIEEIVISIDGRIDTITAPELEKAFQPFLAETSEALVLDCEKLTYISSSGLRVILMAHKQMAANGGKFVLRNLMPEVRSVFDMTGLSRIIPIH